MTSKEMKKEQKSWLKQIRSHMGRKPLTLEELTWDHENQAFLMFRGRRKEFPVYVSLENNEINTEAYPKDFLHGQDLEIFINRLLDFPFEEMFEEMKRLFEKDRNIYTENLTRRNNEHNNNRNYHESSNFNQTTPFYQPNDYSSHHESNRIDHSEGLDRRFGTPETVWVDIDMRDVDPRDIDPREGIDAYLREQEYHEDQRFNHHHDDPDYKDDNYNEYHDRYDDNDRD